MNTRVSPPRRRRQPRIAQGPREIGFLLLVASTPILVYFLASISPWFRAQEIYIEGAFQRVPKPWAHSRVSSLREINIFRISPEDIKASLLQNPWVNSIHLRRVIPNRLYIKIEERQAAALLVRGDSQFVFVDAEGRPIAFGNDKGSEGLLVVYGSGYLTSQETIQGALEVAKYVEKFSPALKARLNSVESLGDHSFRLRFDSSPYQVLVDRDKATEQIQRLNAILSAISRRYSEVQSIDLRFGRQVIVNPREIPQNG